jgi:hypothetical protein
MTAVGNDTSSTSQTVAISVSPTTPPAVFIVSFITINGSDQKGGVKSTSAPYTSIGGIDATCLDDAHALSDSAYRADVASGGTYQFNWMCGTAGFHTCAAMAVPTAAAAPVQTGHTEGGNLADAVTLPAPPTVGNLLVLTRQFSVTGLGFTGVMPPVSGQWTQKVTTGFSNGAFGLNSGCVDICVRCVQPGDGATFSGLNDNNPAQAFAISEWTIV